MTTGLSDFRYRARNVWRRDRRRMTANPVRPRLFNGRRYIGFVRRGFPVAITTLDQSARIAS